MSGFQGHLAQKHLANALPSVTLDIQHTPLICRQTVVCRVFFIGHSANSLPSVSKHSAKINSRQKNFDGMERRRRFCQVHDGKTLGKVSQVCRVSSPKHSVTFLKFAECQDQSTRQSLHTLSSVTLNTLGKQVCNGQILWSLC